MRIERLQQSACWELGKQGFKVGVGICAVIVLALINNNLHELIGCLSRTNPPTPTPAHHSSILNQQCNEKTLHSIVNMTLTCCQHNYIKVTENSIILVEYKMEQAFKFLDWINQCFNAECPLHEYNRSKCTYLSYFQKNMICFDKNKHIDYLVINDHNIHNILSLSVYSFFATMC